MMGFTRGDAPPACANYKTWGKEFHKKCREAKAKREAAAKQAKEDRDTREKQAIPLPSWTWPKVDKQKKLNHIVVEALDQIVNAHCAYCDSWPLGAASRKTIDHFRPKSRAPRLVAFWPNLFLCCDQCQEAKGTSYDRKQLLKPDRDFDFENYFSINFETFALEPNPIATTEDQAKADYTIRALDLNRPALLKSRASEAKRYRPEDHPDDLNFRFMLPYL